MKKLFSIFLTLSLLFSAGSPAHAIYDPLSTPNNRFGIHITDTNDLEDARNLVNSQEGDWGYVTTVMQENDRDYSKWQTFFDICREKHIIPLVRLATIPQGTSWKRPTAGDAPAWANFLNSLNWPVKNKYVMLFNEPNHAKEWGGQTDPASYAEIVEAFSKKLKAEDKDFFILNAGLDASAPESDITTTEERFLQDMLASRPKVFDYIDGWNSHSYPNPAFSSPPQNTGKGSVGTFLWERQLLNELGIEKDLPVFITETGWSQRSLDETTIAGYLKIANETAWNNANIVAVTPFILNYQDGLFSEFSWKTEDGFKEQYKVVQSLPKTKGAPKQKQKAILTMELPERFLANETYTLPLNLDNEGQAIWKKEDGYVLKIEASGLTVEPSELEVNTRPGEVINTKIKITTPQDPGEYGIRLVLKKNNEKAMELTQKITVEKLEEETEPAKEENLQTIAIKILRGILDLGAYL
jgi:hypothetical protein